MKPTKVLSIIKYIFGAIGIGMLALGILLFVQQIQFSKRALKTTGTIVNIEVTTTTSRRNGHTETSKNYNPIINFTTPDGQTTQFRSSYGDSSYQVGDSVEILYDPTNPKKAQINSFGASMLGPIILSIVGLVFGGISAGFFIFGYMKEKKINFLLQNGTPIHGDYTGVELNRSLTVNGQHPFRIAAQWINPATKKMHIFYSDNLWYDPSKYITSDKIKVLIDQNNPNNFHMDISFLPQLA